MKKTIVLVVLSLFAVTALFGARPMRTDKVVARRVLKRTAVVIVTAQMVVKKHKVYTGYLARAYRHQKFAKVLYVRRNFERSVRQSLRARQLAYMAIRANKTVVKDDFDSGENKFVSTLNTDDLDNEVGKEMDQDTVKDEEIVDLKIETEVTE